MSGESPDFLGGRFPADGAPSELLLDRYVAGEASPEEVKRVEQWVAGSTERRERLEARRGFADPSMEERVFARISADLARGGRRASGAAEAGPPWWKKLARLWGPGALALAVAFLVVVVAKPVEPEGLRVKGGLGFLVHKKTPTGSEVLVSGSIVHPGDLLRFEVDLPDPGHVLILNRDAAEVTAVAWPLDGSDATRPLGAGAQALEGAVELDHTLGFEWFFVIRCAAPQGLAAFSVKGQGRLEAPAGCTSVGLRLEKRDARP